MIIESCKMQCSLLVQHVTLRKLNAYMWSKYVCPPCLVLHALINNRLFPRNPPKTLILFGVHKAQRVRLRAWPWTAVWSGRWCHWRSRCLWTSPPGSRPSLAFCCSDAEGTPPGPAPSGWNLHLQTRSTGLQSMDQLNPPTDQSTNQSISQPPSVSIKSTEDQQVGYYPINQTQNSHSVWQSVSENTSFTARRAV